MTTDNHESYPITDRSAAEPVMSQPLVYSPRRIRIGLILTLIGFFVFLMGARPSIFGLDRSPVIGFVQITALLLGLGIICIGAYISMIGLWKNTPINIAAEIGMRLVATGFVIAVVAGMADVFGLGSHPLPKLFFGPWQALGVQIGQLVIAIGIIMMIPFHRFISHQTQSVQLPQNGDMKSEN